MSKNKKNISIILLSSFFLFYILNNVVHALTHETDNGVDVYSMPASTTNPISLPITAADNPKHYDLSVDSIEPALFAGLEAAISKTGSFFTYLISGQLSNTNNFNAIDNPKDYIIKIKDKFDAIGSKMFRLKVMNQKPVIDRISCSYTTKDGVATSTDNAIGQNLFARKNTELNCQGYAHDNDGNAIDIIFSGFPEGLSQNIDSGFLTGLLYHDTSDYAMVARPRDEFGLEGDSVSFQLHIHGTYCGDGIYQYVNDEGVNEQCDGTSNVATLPYGSSVSYQYTCSNCQWGGGWCGDGYCSSDFNENGNNCQYDCAYWATGAWGPCNPGCGIQPRYRSVYCQDIYGNYLSDNFCSHLPRPATTESCPYKPCWGYRVGSPDSLIQCRCNGVYYGGFVNCFAIGTCFDGPAGCRYCRNTYGTAICDY